MTLFDEAMVRFGTSGTLLLWNRLPSVKARAPEADPTRRDFASGLLTSLANPKLAVFFLALFPQFIPDGAPVLPYALVMAAILIAADFVCYVSLGAAVARATRVVASSRLARRIEQLTGAVLIALAGRLTYESR